MFTIGGFYQPPDAPADHMSKLYTTLATLPPQKFTNLVLCGDFKLDCQSDATLNQIQTDFCLLQMVSEPTHITPISSSVLDLVLVSSPFTIHSCQVSAPLSNCDHNAITVGVNLLSRLTKGNHLTQTIWMYTKADIKVESLLMDTPEKRTL